MNKRYLIAAAAYMGLIYFFSAQPPDSKYLPWLPPGADKMAHALEYAGLGFLLGRGLGSRRGAILTATLLSALYGITDEFHQSFVAGRNCSRWDWAADLLGAFAGALAGRGILFDIFRRGGE